MFKTALLTTTLILGGFSWQEEPLARELKGKMVDFASASLSDGAYVAAEKAATGADNLAVCRASVGQLQTDYHSPFRRHNPQWADLALLVTVSQGSSQHLLAARGPNDRGEATFFLTGINLSKPYQLVVTAYDLDVFKHDFIEKVTIAAPNSLPWEKKFQKVSVDCRAWPRREYETFAGQATKRFNERLDELRQVTSLSLAEETVPNVSHLIRRVAEPLRELASLKSWRDSGIQAASAKLRTEEERLHRLLTEAVAGQMAKSKPQVVVGNLTVTAEGYQRKNSLTAVQKKALPIITDIDANAVFPIITIKNNGPEPIAIDEHYFGDLNQLLMVDSRGDADFIYLLLVQRNNQWQASGFTETVAPGETVRFLLGPLHENLLYKVQNLPFLFRIGTIDGQTPPHFLLIK